MCVRLPKPFYEVRVWYEDFSQTTDAEVRDLLRGTRLPQPGKSHLQGIEGTF